MKFSTKLIFLVMGVVVASGTIQAYLYGRSSRLSLETQIIKLLEERAFHTMDKLNRYFYERYNEIETLSSEPLLTWKKASPREIAALLKNHLSWRREYVSAAFYGRDRVLVADTELERVGEQADLESVWGEVATGRDFVVTVSSPRSNSEPMLLLTFVVRDGWGAFRGLLVSRLPLKTLNNLVSSFPGPPGTEEALGIDLVDDKGLTLYCNHNAPGVRRDIAADWSFIEPRIRAGQTFGHLKYTNPGEATGEELLFFVRARGFREYPGNGWTLSVDIPTSVAFAPVAALRKRMLGILLLAAGVLLAVVLVMIRSFTRPLEELARAAREIGRGNLEARVPAGSRDELGLFAETFNSMAVDLQKSQSELKAVNQGLERLVEERTAELLRTNELLHAELSERVKAQEELVVRERLLRLNADVGEALTLGKELSVSLQSCAGHIVRDLDAAFVRIWTPGNKEGVLELRASAGMYTRLDGQHSRKIVGQGKVGIIALEQRPVLTNAVVGDAAITDQEWARREGIVAFAGHPLVVDGKTLGVMALFSRRLLEPFVLSALENVAQRVAAFIGRKQAEEALRASESRYRELFDSASDGIYKTDARGVFTSMNRAGARIFGHENPEEIVGRPALDYWRDPKDRERLRRDLEREKSVVSWRVAARKKNGEFLELETSSRILEGEDGAFLGIEGMLRDVTRRVKDEAERDLLLAQLQEAAANVKTLSGLLPICSGCKKIRDDKGSWSQIETYIRKHSEAEFTHGLCLECQKVYFPSVGGKR